MKNIEIDEELYQYIAAKTQFIGESASVILRRLLNLETPKISQDNAINSVAKPTSVDGKIKEEALPIAGTPTLATNDHLTNSSTSSVSNHDTVFNFINKEELAMQRGAVGRFLLILAALYRAHPQHFNVVTDICGRDRLYFANSEEKLAASGSSTKPRQIPDSPFWVITNSNTTRKKMMLTKAATSLGYLEEDVEKIRELL